MDNSTALDFPGDPPRPLVVEVDLLKLSSREWRRAWHDSKIPWMIAGSLKAARIQRGWTQDQLAEHSGVAQQSICRIENPRMKHFPTIKTLLKLSHALDVALIVRFITWSEWLPMLEEMERGCLYAPCYDKEVKDQESKP